MSPSSHSCSFPTLMALSSSTFSGSSARKRGPALWPADTSPVKSTAAHVVASAPRRRLRLESIAQLQIEARALGRAERALDPQEYAVGRAEAKAEPVVGLQRAEVAERRAHAACLVEHDAVGAREDLEPVFGLHQRDGPI